MRRPFWISYLEFLDFFHLKTLEKHHWSNSNQTNENSLTWPEIQTYCKKVEFFLVKKSEKGLSQYGWWCSVWWLKIFLTMTCLTKLFPVNFRNRHKNYWILLVYKKKYKRQKAVLANCAPLPYSLSSTLVRSEINGWEFVTGILVVGFLSRSKVFVYIKTR